MTVDQLNVMLTVRHAVWVVRVVLKKNWGVMLPYLHSSSRGKQYHALMLWFGLIFNFITNMRRMLCFSKFYVCVIKLFYVLWFKFNEMILQYILVETFLMTYECDRNLNVNVKSAYNWNFNPRKFMAAFFAITEFMFVTL